MGELYNRKHGDHGTKFYRIWCDIKKRCNYKKHNRYSHYGGRGITYDLTWNNYLNFKKDMYFKYVYAKKLFGEDCLSIDRKNVNGNYDKSNCEFIPKSCQNGNRSNNKVFKAISPNGKIYFSKNQLQFAKRFGLKDDSVNSVLHNRRKSHYGWVFTFLNER